MKRWDSHKYGNSGKYTRQFETFLTLNKTFGDITLSAFVSLYPSHGYKAFFLSRFLWLHLPYPYFESDFESGLVPIQKGTSRLPSFLIFQMPLPKAPSLPLFPPPEHVHTSPLSPANSNAREFFSAPVVSCRFQSPASQIHVGVCGK